MDNTSSADNHGQSDLGFVIRFDMGKRYLVSEYNGPFPMSQSLEDWLHSGVAKKMFALDQPKLVELNIQNLPNLLSLNSTALESLLEEITGTALPKLIQLTFVIATRPERDVLIQRFVNILRPVFRRAKPTEVHIKDRYNQSSNTDSNGFPLWIQDNSSFCLTGDEFKIEIARPYNLLHPIAEEALLQLPTVKNFVLTQRSWLPSNIAENSDHRPWVTKGMKLRDASFHTIINNASNLQHLTLNGIVLNGFHVSALLTGLHTAGGKTTILANGRLQRKRKRKRGQALGALYQLRSLNFKLVTIQPYAMDTETPKDIVGWLFRGLAEDNTTLETFCFECCKIMSSYDHHSSPEEFYDPVLHLLRNNKTLRHLKVCGIVDEDSPVDMSRQHPPSFLSNDLPVTLRDNNPSISTLVLGNRGNKIPYDSFSPLTQNLLLLNRYKLRTITYILPPQTTNQHNQHHESNSSSNDRMIVAGNSNNCSKQQFFNSIVCAMEIYAKEEEEMEKERARARARGGGGGGDDDDDNNQGRPTTSTTDSDDAAYNTAAELEEEIVTCLFLVFQRNPSLVQFLSEEMCSSS